MNASSSAVRAGSVSSSSPESASLPPWSLSHRSFSFAETSLDLPPFSERREARFEGAFLDFLDRRPTEISSSLSSSASESTSAFGAFAFFFAAGASSSSESSSSPKTSFMRSGAAPAAPSGFASVPGSAPASGATPSSSSSSTMGAIAMRTLSGVRLSRARSRGRQ